LSATVDFSVAVKHPAYFIDFPNPIARNTFKSELKNMIKNASILLVDYSRSVGVDMQKEELLRDVCFLGAVVSWRFNHQRWCYDALVAACADIVEHATGRRYQDNFIKKLKKCGGYFTFKNGESSSSIAFATIPFYLLFKAAIRLEDDVLLDDETPTIPTSQPSQSHHQSSL